MSPRTDKSLILIGSGPGVGSAVAALFASKRYSKVALIARRQAQLDVDRKTVEAAAEGVTVQTYAIDVTDSAKLVATLDQIRETLGAPETVYFNAARVVPTNALEVSEEYLEEDFKITVPALHVTARWALPQLVALGQDLAARPSFLVTNSTLYKDLLPFVFSLSITKSAQRNMVQLLAEVYRPQGVHVGLVTVKGQVSSEHPVYNPKNIAQKAWGLFDEAKGVNTFEVVIEE